MTDWTGLEVAIVGMAGRFPGARDLEALWRNLRQGVESISFFSEEELLAAGIPETELRRADYVPARSVLDEADRFDAGLFGYSPREAEIMDPQHRVFLECAWEAVESAGYDPDAFSGRIGVYAGVSMSTYLLFNLLPNPGLLAEVGSFQAMIGNDKDYLPTRVSYKLNLKGPSVLVQTACSTSLVAVHLACQGLLNGECEMALAGGVSISFPQKRGYRYEQGAIFSPDGHCRAFDAQALGTVNGEGAGVVVLRRLEDALAAGNTVLAVIKGSAINNDGSLKVGFTAPSVDGQTGVIRAAQIVAGVDAGSISYVEAHGTGTPLGDPIEVRALTEAFRATTRRQGFCGLGSLKTNFGHLDAAAGVAGLIKTVLALRHREIPPHLHFREPNPEIDFASSPFYVNASLQEWPAGDGPRRAAVSSFGIGGTNAHVILEEAPAVAPSPPGSRPWQLLVLSARTAEALEEATDRLASLLETPSADLADIAYTLQVGRRFMAHRRAVVCRGPEEAAAALSARDPKAVFSAVEERRDRPVVFLFPGQGAQYPGMARGLYESEPAFREPVDRCAEHLRPLLGLDLREVLFSSAEEEEAAELLRQTRLAQPALFVVGYALARLWQQWGVQPAALCGHSVGEYVAACLAGVFSLENALDLVAARGRMMQNLPRGAMLSVTLPPERVLPLLGSALSLAAVNAPALCVVAGPPRAVEELGEELSRQGVEHRLLHTSRAFHSAAMEPVVEPFQRLVAGVGLQPPRMRWVSNVTGTWITEAEATDPAYWARQLREPVLFSEGVAALLAEPDAVLLEVGPGRILGTLVRQHPGYRSGQAVISSLRHPQEAQDDQPFLLRALGRLWLAGVKPDWKGFHAPDTPGRRRVPLPTYRFARDRYWVEPPARGAAPAEFPAAGRRPDPADWFSVAAWRRSLPPPLPARPAEGSWLVLHGGQGGDLGRALMARLRERGETAVEGVAVAGAVPGWVGSATFALDPAQEEGFEALAGALAARGLAPARVLHLWTLGPEPPVYAGFAGLLPLARALGGTSPQASFLVVTDRTQEVTGAEALRPDKAMVLAACRALPREIPGSACRALDLEPGAGPEHADPVLAEALSPGTELAAYRHGHRWVTAFEPVRAAAPEEGATVRPRVFDSARLPTAPGPLATELATLERTVEPGGLAVLASPVDGGSSVEEDARDLFLDAWARERTRMGSVRWLRLRWDGQSPDLGDDLALTPGEAADVLRRVASLPALAPVWVSAVPLAARGARTRRPAATPPVRHARPGLTTPYAAPTSEAEREIAAIWEDLLGVAPVGRHDDFFDLGGHSLLATRVGSRLREAFGVEVPVRRVLEAPTVAELAAAVEAALSEPGGAPAPSKTIWPVPRTGPLPLSFAQARLFFLDQVKPGRPEYNIPFALRLRGPLDAAALEWGLREIERRHETLRTTFALTGGEAVQVVHAEPVSSLPVADLRGLPVARRESEARRRAELEAHAPFDLHRGLLFRATLLRLDEEEAVLLFTMHHIISDGWSFGVVTRELSELYRARLADEAPRLPELPIQYGDFAAWQRQHLQGEVLAGQLSYWTRRLEGAPRSLRLPTDRSVPAAETHEGALHPLAFPLSLAHGLAELGRSRRATMFMTLLAAYSALLHGLSEDDDLCVGSPIAGRGHRETEGLIGFFVNTLVLRTDLSGDPTFVELLDRVRETTLAAYAHQDLPFEQLVSALRLDRPDRDRGRNPLFRVWFVLQNTPLPALDLPGLEVSALTPGRVAVRHDLKLELSEKPDGLKGYFEYKRDLFDAATVARIAEQLGRLLERVVERPSSTLGDLRQTLGEIARSQQAQVQQDLKRASLEKLRQSSRRAVR